MKKIKILALVIAIILPTFFATGCKGGSDSSKVLNVYNVGDYIDEDLIKEFTKRTGIEVQYSTYDTNEMMYQKVKSKSTNYDLVFPSDYMVSKMIKEGLLEKIDYTKIPNFKNIDDNFKHNDFDPNDEYSIAYMWGTLGIVYNKKYFKTPPDSWNIFWDSRYKGNMLMFDSVRDTIGASLFRLGYSMNSTNPKEINEAKEELIKQKPNVLAYVNDEGKDRMIGEEAIMGMFYSGDVPTMIVENENLAYAIPKEGTNKWIDAMCIPTTAQNKEWAEEFINFLLDPEISKQNTEYIGYSTPNKETLKILDPEMRDDKSLYPDEKILEKCESFIDVGKYLKYYDKAWIDLKTR